MIEVMGVIVYCEVWGNWWYGIGWIRNGWGEMGILGVKKLRWDKWGRSMRGWKRIWSISMGCFVFKGIFDGIENDWDSWIRDWENYCGGFKGMVGFERWKV